MVKRKNEILGTAMKKLVIIILMLLIGTLAVSCATIRSGMLPRLRSGVPDYRKVPGKPVDIWHTNTNVVVMNGETNFEVEVERSFTKIDKKTGEVVLLDLRDIRLISDIQCSTNLKMIHWKSVADNNKSISEYDFLNMGAIDILKYDYVKNIDYHIDFLIVAIDTNRVDYIDMLNFLKKYNTSLITSRYSDIKEKNIIEWFNNYKRYNADKKNINTYLDDMRSLGITKGLYIDKDSQLGVFYIWTPDDIDVDDFYQILLSDLPFVKWVERVTPGKADTEK